jgi:RNA polymerase sigma factor (sigma-70 family)
MTVMDPGDDHPPAAPRQATDSDEPITLTEAPTPTPVPQLTAEQIAAYGSFYRGHVERLVAFLLWYGADLAEATDIAQETMIKAFHHWNSLTNPAAWVRTTASRKFIRRRTQSREDPTEEISEPQPSSALLRTDTSAIALEEQHEQQQVLELLASLPPRQRQVMAWTYDGFSPAEIAAELSTPKHPLTSEAVRASLKLARRNLAERLGPGKGQS